MTAEVPEKFASSTMRTLERAADPAYADARQCVCSTWDMPSLALAMNLC
jgi:hypothetical protein